MRGFLADLALLGKDGLRRGRELYLGRTFGNGAPFWLDLQGRHDIALVQREHGEEMARRVRPAA